MTAGNPPTVGGLFGSLRRLLATVVETAQVRLELLGTELELEKQRIFSGLFWGAVALLALGVGALLACGFVVLLFWEGYRLTAVGLLALAFLAGAVLLIRHAQERLRSAGGMFGASVAELSRDHADLDPHP